MKRMLHTFIDELGHELGIEGRPSSPEESRYLIPIDPNVEVEAVECENSCLLKGIIGAPPNQNTETFLLQAMEANLFGMGTRGAAIGLNEEGKLLTLSLEVDYNGSYKDFKEKLEDFISVLDFWRNEALNGGV